MQAINNYRSETLFAITWRRFKHHRMAFISLWLMVFIILSTILVPVIMEIIHGSGIMGLHPDSIYAPPSTKHLLGVDNRGFDVFTRLFYGGRISLIVGFTAAISSSIIGSLIGVIAGYSNKLVDSILMRLVDSFLSIPTLPLMIVFSAMDYKALGLEFLKTTIEGNIIRLDFVIVLFGWMGTARLVRGEVLTLKNREFIKASQAAGASKLRIILTHLIPNTLTPVIISTTLSLGSIIITEAVISFLGYGIQSPIPSWGNMLTDAQDFFHRNPLLAVYPGVFLTLTVVAFNFIGDGLRDALDPKSILKR